VDLKQLHDLIALVGFNGALVVLLLWMGKTFLASLLNHISHIQAEMEKHTSLLGQLLAQHKSGRRLGKKHG